MVFDIYSANSAANTYREGVFKIKNHFTDHLLTDPDNRQTTRSTGQTTVELVASSDHCYVPGSSWYVPVSLAPLVVVTTGPCQAAAGTCQYLDAGS